MKDRTALIAVVVIVVALAILSVVTWLIVLQAPGASDNTAKVIGAALTTVGAFVGGMVAIAGVLLKFTIDRRSESRAEIEAARNALSQAEAEGRLKLEAAIRAVQLLSTSSGGPVQKVQRSGALITLASLGLHEITLSLVSELLPAKEIEPAAAARLIDRALLSGRVDHCEEAIGLLVTQAHNLGTESGYELPHCIISPVPGLPRVIRDWAPVVIATVLLTKPASNWRQIHNLVNPLLAALVIWWQQEDDEQIKIDAATILNAVITAFPDVTVLHSSGRLELAAVKHLLQADNTKSSVQADSLARELSAWGNQATPDPKA